MFFFSNNDNGTLCLRSSLEFSNNVHIHYFIWSFQGLYEGERVVKKREPSPGLQQPAGFSQGRRRAALALRVSADSSSSSSCLALSRPCFSFLRCFLTLCRRLHAEFPPWSAGLAGWILLPWLQIQVPLSPQNLPWGPWVFALSPATPACHRHPKTGCLGVLDNACVLVCLSRGRG